MKPITITFAGYGHFKITSLYRGKEYSTISTNTMAIDRYRNDNIPPHIKEQHYSYNGAALTLYNEIKRANNLK